MRTVGIYRPTTDDDRLARGGPVLKHTGCHFGHAPVSTDPRRRAVFDLSLEGSRGVDAPTRSLSVPPGVAFKSAANVFVQLAPRDSVDEDAAPYVTAVADPTAAAFGGTRSAARVRRHALGGTRSAARARRHALGGTRYVFTYFRARTLSLDTRVNWGPASSALFRERPDNVFLLKMTYWIGR